VNIVKATEAYESWLGSRIRLLPAGIERKHEIMADDIRAFFRGTYYRWVQLFHAMGDYSSCPKVLTAGDTHLDNFGTWRDAEGRLAWGINDFDETSSLPYVNDLIRLAVSAQLSIAIRGLPISMTDACDAILNGYASCLDSGGGPFVLAEQHGWLRLLAFANLRDPARFWEKLTTFPVTRGLPAKVKKRFQHLLPERGCKVRVVSRTAGVGSLGRERYVAIAAVNGGLWAREAKALAPSAALWMSEGRPSGNLYNRLLDATIRSSDPFVREKAGWIYRRLAPDCVRIDLTTV
jgi:uncharacterized protein (DUF2252 family)